MPKDGVPAVSTGLRGILALAVDNSGNVFFADLYGTARIRRISPSGIVSTIAGGGTDSPGDNEAATSATLRGPVGLAVDGDGNLFVADNGDRRVRRIDTQWMITTIAGTGVSGFSGDGGAAVDAQLDGPSAVSVDGSGNVYLADNGNYRVRKVSLDGIISTIAGGGKAFPGDGTLATGVSVCADSLSLSALANDADGNLYIADCWVQKVTPDGILHNIAGNGIYSLGGDGGPAAYAQFYGPSSVAVDAGGNLFIADTMNSRIRKVGVDGNIATIAGNGQFPGYSGDGGPASQAVLGSPTSLVLDGGGSLFFTDFNGHTGRIRKIAPDGTITTVAGGGTSTYSPDGTTALGGSVGAGAFIFDGSGSLIFIEGTRVRKIQADGTIATIAGNASYGFSGDGGPASAATLSVGRALAMDRSNNLLVADFGNNRIRMITPDGIITTIAGNGSYGTAGNMGDGGLATNASLDLPQSLAVDDLGNILVSDQWGLRRISTDGIIRTIVPGSPFSHVSSGDGGPASEAALTAGALTLDAAGKIYVLDVPGSVDSSVRLLQPTNQGILTGSVRDAASQSVAPISPGKIVVIYGVGMGPQQLVLNQPQSGVFPNKLAGTQVFFDGVPAPLVYTSATQVAVAAPYAISGAATAVTVQYNGQTSSLYSLPIAASSPGIFSTNGTGAGQAAAVNPDGTGNDAAHPAKIGDFLSLYVTGEGQTTPSGSDGKVVGLTAPFPKPLLPVTVQIGGVSANVSYAGAAPGQIAGLMQVVVQIPASVQPGGYVSVQVSVGGNSTGAGSAWIAVSAN